MSEPLADVVRRFLDDLTPIVVALDGKPADVALDAFELTAAFVDADGLHTDNELWALIAVFGPLLESQLGRATPADVRAAGLVTGKRTKLDRPSALFDVLVAADRRNRTTAAWTYYELAMAMGHEIAAVDSHVSHLELAALEAYRTALLRMLRDIPRTDAPAPAAAAEAAAEAAAPARSLEDLYAELDRLVGLDAVKKEVKLVANLVRVQRMREERGLPVTESSRHLVFTGNPGTGKTTVARLLAELYRTLGVVEKGHLVETDRGGLVAGYVGQTAGKVKQVFDSALGGVLLIDEAYALARGREGDFGQEAIDTLVKLIEDHRDDVVVILTGYPAEMGELVASNPGFRSRFPRTIHFPDYTDDELVRIFASLAEAGGYATDDAALAAARRRFEAEPRGPGFGNGRMARNLFEAALAAQATRVVDLPDLTDAQLVGLTAADIDAAAIG